MEEDWDDITSECKLCEKRTAVSPFWYSAGIYHKGSLVGFWVDDRWNEVSVGHIYRIEAQGSAIRIWRRR